MATSATETPVDLEVDQDLAELADVVIEGIVRSVRETEVILPTDSTSGFSNREYHTSLYITDILYGGHSKCKHGNVVDVSFWQAKERPPDWGGFRGQDAIPKDGMKIRMYIEVDEDDGSFLLLEPRGWYPIVVWLCGQKYATPCAVKGVNRYVEGEYGKLFEKGFGTRRSNQNPEKRGRKPTPSRKDSFDLFGSQSGSPRLHHQSSTSTNQSSAPVSPTSTPSASHLNTPLSPAESVTSAASSGSGRRRREAYERHGNAVDIIVVKGPKGELFSTPWHIAFSYSRWSAYEQGVGDEIKILINDDEFQAKMTLQSKGRARFQGGGLVPPAYALGSVPIHDGMNIVRLEHRPSNSPGLVRFVETRLFLWSYLDRIIVSDLDGTVTPSDVEGHIRTLRLGQYDFLHSGICKFFDTLQSLGCHILYLTARPISWADMSRTHIDNAFQDNVKLPVGPVITNSEGMFSALTMEVIKRNPHVFKSRVLTEILECFYAAGRHRRSKVFVCGFGNRITDVQAYQEAGIIDDCIFLIDSMSLLHPYSNIKAALRSYQDPRLLMYMIPCIRDFFAPEEQVRLDAVFSRMVYEVEADSLRKEERLRVEKELHEKYGQRDSGSSNGNVPYVRPPPPPSSPQAPFQMPPQLQRHRSSDASRGNISHNPGAEHDDDGDLFGSLSSSAASSLTAEERRMVNLSSISSIDDSGRVNSTALKETGSTLPDILPLVPSSNGKSDDTQYLAKEISVPEPTAKTQSLQLSSELTRQLRQTPNVQQGNPALPSILPLVPSKSPYSTDKAEGLAKEVTVSEPFARAPSLHSSPERTRELDRTPNVQKSSTEARASPSQQDDDDEDYNLF